MPILARQQPVAEDSGYGFGGQQSSLSEEERSGHSSLAQKDRRWCGMDRHKIPAGMSYSNYRAADISGNGW